MTIETSWANKKKLLIEISGLKTNSYYVQLTNKFIN